MPAMLLRHHGRCHYQQAVHLLCVDVWGHGHLYFLCETMRQACCSRCGYDYLFLLAVDSECLGKVPTELACKVERVSGGMPAPGVGTAAIAPQMKMPTVCASGLWPLQQPGMPTFHRLGLKTSIRRAHRASLHGVEMQLPASFWNFQWPAACAAQPRAAVADGRAVPSQSWYHFVSVLGLRAPRADFPPPVR